MDRIIQKVFLSITNRCNNQCLYCFQDKDEIIHDMPVELLENIFAELDILKVKKIILSGGEATLHSSFEDILNNLDNYMFEVGLFSNGIINDEVISLINRSKINPIYLSLDGTDDKYNQSRGSAKIEVIENCIKKLNKQIIIMNTLNAKNYINTQQFIEYCIKEEKVKKINFNPIKILHNSYQEMELTSEMLSFVNRKIGEYKKKCDLNMRSYYNSEEEVIMNCTAGKTSFAIDLNGDVSGCIFGSSICAEKFVVGNVFREKIVDIWEDEKRWDIFINSADSICEACFQFGKRCSGICCIEKYLAKTRMADCLCKMR